MGVFRGVQPSLKEIQGIFLRKSWVRLEACGKDHGV